MSCPASGCASPANWRCGHCARIIELCRRHMAEHDTAQHPDCSNPLGCYLQPCLRPAQSAAGEPG
jgi:hypothetical protein